MQDLIPISQAATEVGVDQATLYRYLKQGRLKRYKRGFDKKTYLDRSEIKRLSKPHVVEAS